MALLIDLDTSIGILVVNTENFRDLLKDDQDEKLNILTEKLLRKWGEEPENGEFYSIEQREDVISELMPAGDPLEAMIIKLLYEKTRIRMLDELLRG